MFLSFFERKFDLPKTSIKSNKIILTARFFLKSYKLRYNFNTLSLYANNFLEKLDCSRPCFEVWVRLEIFEFRQVYICYCFDILSLCRNIEGRVTKPHQSFRFRVCYRMLGWISSSSEPLDVQVCMETWMVLVSCCQKNFYHPPISRHVNSF